MEDVRLNKFIADCGYCSRREADRLIEAGKVTVNGAKVTSYMANVDSDAAYTPDHETVENGAIKESKHRSAPYFGLDIDGITLLN